jgi:hypothetical protein
MVTDAEQYQKAQEELQLLEDRLHRSQQSYPLGEKAFTKAGIRKMIARLHEELALYEGSQEIHQTDPANCRMGLIALQLSDTAQDALRRSIQSQIAI